MKAVNFLLMRLYTSNLTTEMLGVSDSITTFTGLLFPVLVLGLDSAFSAFYFDNTNEDQSSKVFTTILITMSLLGLIPLIGIFFSGQLSLFLFKSTQYKTAIIIALSSVSFNLWFLPYALNTRMQNKMLMFGTINFAGSFLMVCLNILFVTYLKLGTISLIASTAIINVFELILYLLFGKTKICINKFNFSLLKSMLRFAIPIIPSTLMLWVLSLSDRYLILHYCGKSAVGIYGIGSRFVLLLNAVITGVTTAYTTFAFSNKNNKNANEQYSKILNLVSLFLLATCFTVALFSKELVSLLTAPSYHSGYVIIRNLMFAQMMFGITSIVSYGIYFEKKPIYALIASMAGAITNVVLNIYLIPHYGIKAAAITTLLGYCITFVFSYTASQKLYYCKYRIFRILGCFIALYLISFVFVEKNLVLKLTVFALSAVVTSYIFKDVLIDIYNLIISTFKKRRCKVKE